MSSYRFFPDKNKKKRLLTLPQWARNRFGNKNVGIQNDISFCQARCKASTGQSPANQLQISQYGLIGTECRRNHWKLFFIGS